MQLAIIVAIVIAIAGVAFATQNSVPATVVFLVWRFDGSLGVIVLLALALGALVAALVSTPAALRANWVARRQRKEIDSLKLAHAEAQARAVELERRAASSLSATVPAEAPDLPEPVGFQGTTARFETFERDAEPKA